MMESFDKNMICWSVKKAYGFFRTVFYFIYFFTPGNKLLLNTSLIPTGYGQYRQHTHSVTRFSLDST